MRRLMVAGVRARVRKLPETFPESENESKRLQVIVREKNPPQGLKSEAVNLIIEREKIKPSQQFLQAPQTQNPSSLKSIWWLQKFLALFILMLLLSNVLALHNVPLLAHISTHSWQSCLFIGGNVHRATVYSSFDFPSCVHKVGEVSPREPVIRWKSQKRLWKLCFRIIYHFVYYSVKGVFIHTRTFDD